jgi:serine/threonine protein kinase
VKSQQKAPVFLRSSGGKKKKSSITLNDFQQIHKLGQGAIGEVFLVRHKRTGLICCLKIIRKEHIQNEHCEENIDR